MASVLIEGTPSNASNTRICKEITAAAYTIEDDDDDLVVATTGLTLTLPANPRPNQRHRVLSLAGVTTTVAASGTGITLPSGGTVAASTYRDYQFCANLPGTGAGGVWLSQAVA